VSSFALLGHVLANESGPTDPSIDEFLDIIRSTLERPRTANKARSNALLALVHAVTNPSASDERLFGFVERLIEIFMCIEDDSGCIINAAWALTNICAPRATDQAAIDVITRSDVFLHLSGLLRAEFPRSTEKLAIFTNVIRMITPAIDKVQ